MTPTTAALMADYNRWMNERVYEAAGKLDDATLTADKGAFFGSILGTLNHIAVADSIWLHRFAQHPASFAALGAMTAFPQPTSLTQPLAPNLAALRDYRRRLDEVIERWVPELTQEQLSGDITYASLAGVRTRKNFSLLLQHFFNHQTHHRGQVTTLLHQSGVDVGATDLLAMPLRSEH